MDPSTIFQAAMEALPLLVLRVVAVILACMALGLAACALGGLGCHRLRRKHT